MFTKRPFQAVDKRTPVTWSGNQVFKYPTILVARRNLYNYFQKTYLESSHSRGPYPPPHRARILKLGSEVRNKTPISEEISFDSQDLPRLGSGNNHHAYKRL